MKYIVGVDIGATNLRVALADSSGNIIVKVTDRTVKKGKGIDLTNQVIRLIKTVLNRASVNVGDVKGIGIGTIGPLDLKKGVITKPANLQLSEVPLREPLEDKFKVPVYILNDCVAAVVGEKVFGAGKHLENLVYITISTGIGSGVFVNGTLLLGKDGNAHEVGHMVVDIEGKIVCGCGKRGHWEAYASGTGIPKYAKYLLETKFGKEAEKSSIYAKAMAGILTAKDVYDAAKQGDEIALKIVEEVGRINAIGIANVINIYDPSLITLGGSVVLKNVNLVLDPILRNVSKYTINRIPEIMITPLGEDIVLLGAIGSVIIDVNTIPKD